MRSSAREPALARGLALGVAFGAAALFPRRALAQDDWTTRVAPPPPAPGEPPAPAPPPLPEAPGAQFGSRGQVVVTGESSAGVWHTGWDSSAASSFSAYFAPGIDWFFVRNVSLGIDLNLSYSDGQGYGADGSLVETKTTTVGFSPHLGVNLPLGRFVSFYPRLEPGVEIVHRSEALLSGKSLSIAGSPLGAPSTTQVGPIVDLYAPLLLHPAPHFLVGLGPVLFHEFGRATGGPNVGGERTTLGGRFLIGGHWGETTDAPAGTAPAPLQPPLTFRVPHFGDELCVVLSSETVATGYWTTYNGTGAALTSFTFTPGIDVFVGPHFSLGLGLTGGYVTTKAPDATTGTMVTFKRTSLAASPRIGIDIPIVSWLSVYPRVWLAFGVDSYDERSGASVNKYSETRTSVGLHVPLLVHVATHYFLGFGPSASHDLTRTNDVNDRQNRSTSVGAGLLVGGWL